MNIREQVSLAPLTTFRIGGPARVLVGAETIEDVQEALAFAKTQNLPLAVLGGGSNVLVPDAGVDGVVLTLDTRAIAIDGGELVADAGASWNEIVDLAGERGLFGIENLAGIPGTIGGAVVQNIGAYGSELSEVFAWAECVDLSTGAVCRISATDAGFGYRDSVFKKDRNLVIVRVGLALSRHGEPRLTYPDLAKALEEGVPLTSPREIADAVRAIRSRKFPDLAETGTAGSFFKNPIVSESKASELLHTFPELKHFPQGDGRVKLSLAWILDHVLSLRGFQKGEARLFERQPLVIVATHGATAEDVGALADEVARRVYEAIGIRIEREVETFGPNAKGVG